MPTGFQRTKRKINKCKKVNLHRRRYGVKKSATEDADVSINLTKYHRTPDYRYECEFFCGMSRPQASHRKLTTRQICGGQREFYYQ